MSKDINIKESIEDDVTWFNIKRFKIGRINVERPIKPLDLKYCTKSKFNEYFGSGCSFNFFEQSKIIPNYSIISKIEDYGDKELKSFFGVEKWRENLPIMMNFTLKFNPYKSASSVQEMASFYDMYHGYSNPFLFIPNIQLKRGNEAIIKPDEYVRFVDESYELLGLKNSKPIFVPLSMRMTIKQMKEILSHYIKQEYYNFWIDFEGKQIDQTSIGRLRNLNRNLSELGVFDKVVTYYTNVRREIVSSEGLIQTPASDVLCSITGANFIGVNRSPQRGIEQKEGQPRPQPKPPDHIYRLFDNLSYYYMKNPDAELYHKGVNRINNCLRLDSEFTTQTDYFLSHFEVENFIKQKRMLTEYSEGAIHKRLLTK